MAEHVRACSLLFERGELPRAGALCTLLGVGPGNARRYARLATLDPALVAGIGVGALPALVAAEIARLKAPSDRLLLSALASCEEWGVSGENGVSRLVRMVSEGRSLKDALRARHGIDVCEPVPWPTLLVMPWVDRAALCVRAWSHGTDPAGMVKRDVARAVHEENQVLRARLASLSAELERLSCSAGVMARD